MPDREKDTNAALTTNVSIISKQFTHKAKQNKF